MERKKVKIKFDSESKIVRTEAIFDWKLEKSEKNYLYFSRDNKTPYYQDLKKIEYNFRPHYIPLWVMCIISFLAIGLATFYLIAFLNNEGDFDIIKYFLLLFLPAIICVIIDAVLFFLRYKQMVKYIDGEIKSLTESEYKIQILKERYAKQNLEN